MRIRRYYLQKYNEKPEWDIWLETANMDTSNPTVGVFCNSENGKTLLVSLTIPSIMRFSKAVDEIMLNVCPVHADTFEEDDPVDNH